MPAKNSLKQYLEKGYYHIYNRGVEKRKIFLDKQDYSVLLSYLKEYLLPKNEKELKERLSNPTITSIERDNILKTLRLNNFSSEITLLAFCLMPNHFHFFIKQKNPNAIDKFMRSLCTRYSMFFNKKYKRVGSLYQGVYKAVLINSESQFLHLSKYIHKQALAFQGFSLESYAGQPSSYLEYIGKGETEWVKPEEILSYFSKNNSSLSYEAFVKEDDDYEILQNLTLEEI
ncbi:MAG: transposase [Candidatus Levybacteria bacterium]|nr:transposase [Candidatus Levybacteria bacterium]